MNLSSKHFLWPVPLAVLAPGGLCRPEVHRSEGGAAGLKSESPTCIAMQTKAVPLPFGYGASLNVTVASGQLAAIVRRALASVPSTVRFQRSFAVTQSVA